LTLLKPILALAAAAAATAAIVPITSAPAASPDSLTLDAHLDRATMRMVDQRPKGRSGGDTFVFSTSLTRGGKPAGRGEFTQTIVDDRYQGVSIHADLLLADGTLELAGGGLNRRPPGGAAPARNSSDMAVTGGTGAYAGARGSVHLVDVGRTTQRLEVALAG
jgi:hypothetical protein